MLQNKGQCTTGLTATTVQSSKQLIVKLHAKNQKNLEWDSEYNFGPKSILSFFLRKSPF